MKNKLVAFAALPMLGLAVWVGLGYHTGVKVEEAVKSWSAPAAGVSVDSAWKVTDLKHSRGLFASSGEFHLVYTDAEDSYPFLVAYSVDHKALPTEAARFSWLLLPEGPLAVELKAVVGTDLKLTGEGTIDYTGGLMSDIRVPQVSIRKSGASLSLVPSTGAVLFDAKRVELQWKLDKLVMRGNGQAFEVQDTAVRVDVDNKTRSKAFARLTVAQINTSLGSLEGLDLTAESRRNGDRFDTSVSQSVAKIEGGGQEFSNLQIKWEVNGLHAESVEKLVQVAQESGEMKSLTSKDRKMAAEAIETLFSRGFSFGVPTMTGSAKSAGFEGAFTVSVAPAQGAENALADRVRSSGKAALKGSLLAPEQREAVASAGLAVVQGDTLTASYEYSKGLLKVNSRALDATFLDEALAKMDSELLAALSGLKKQP